jgi:hypothetical protein
MRQHRDFDGLQQQLKEEGAVLKIWTRAQTFGVMFSYSE